MVAIKDVTRWLKALDPGNFVAIDDGGLTLVELDPNGAETGAYLEVGGTPTDDSEAE